MGKIETNIFEILNLDELKCQYKTYKVMGLNKDSDDYDKNIGILVGNLRSHTKSPCVSFKDGDNTFIAQPVGFRKIPEKVTLVRQPVKLEENERTRELSFSDLKGRNGDIALGFLKFFFEQPLYARNSLWSPRAGAPFYNKIPDRKMHKSSDKVDLYRGFSVRVVLLENNKIGLCVDTSYKYIARNYIDSKIDINEINKYKGKTVLYEYGNQWYEIRIVGINELPINELNIGEETLFENVHRNAGNAKSPRLVGLPADCSAFFYINTFGQQRNVPTALCKFTYQTNHPHVSRFHKLTIRPPKARKEEIQYVVNGHLRNVYFNKVKVALSEEPVSINQRKVTIPDLRFGNGKILSVTRNPDAECVSLAKLGESKQMLVYNPEAGLYKKGQFDRQYFIMPKSIYDSYGSIFLDDLKYEVERFYKKNDGITYGPSIIHYNDSVRKSIYNLGQEIIEVVKKSMTHPGYGVVMVPRLSSNHTKEDELGNYVMSKLRELNLHTSIIHMDTVEESFTYDNEEGGYSLKFDRKQKGKYKGYVRNVALNKVILLNGHLPFILEEPLHADLTIGIDVKNNTAGFTFVYKNGQHVRFFASDSSQKEKLMEKQLLKKLTDFIEEEQGYLNKEIRNIVIHRDGRLFRSEISGIKKAINYLSQRSIISPDASITFAEIRKTMSAPVRLFERFSPEGSHEMTVRNPIIGTYLNLGKNESYICNTGFPYWHRGTTKPLHVVKVEGSLTVQQIIEDIFYLSNLTWTKLDYCSRVPITIRLTDIYLKEIAGSFDEDQFEFVITEEGEENE